MKMFYTPHFYQRFFRLGIASLSGSESTLYKLTLNKKKTKFMIIGLRYRLASVVNSSVITIAENNINEESLDIILDEQLK